MIPTIEKNSYISIIGASGFIGKRLVADLVQKGGYKISVLSRNKQRDLSEVGFGQAVEVFEGDLSKPETLKEIFVPGSTVINLAYLRNAGEELNLTCTQNLLVACNEAKVALLIHCSTADVAGRVTYDMCDEQTHCLPITEYATIKLKIEHAVTDFARNKFDAVILRPTAVLGIGGESLKKLASDISKGSQWKNYLKSCLFGRRRMNLVPVANVSAAIIFLAQHVGYFRGDIFIISEDDDEKNNFFDVERILMKTLGKSDYLLPRFPVSLVVLRLLLMLLRRNNVNPRCDFSPDKLHKLGFKSPVSLSAGLAEYAVWYRETQFGKKKPSNT